MNAYKIVPYITKLSIIVDVYGGRPVDPYRLRYFFFFGTLASQKKKTAPATFTQMYTHSSPKFLQTSSYEIQRALKNTFGSPNEQKPQDCVSSGF